MKFIQILQLALLQSTAILSSPTNSPAALVDDVVPRALNAVPRSDPRCSRNLDDLQTIAESGAKVEFIVTYTLGASTISGAVCQILTGRGIGPIQPNECAPYAALIGASTGVIYAIVQNSKQGSISAPSSRRRDGEESSLVAVLREHLAGTNTTVEGGVQDFSNEAFARLTKTKRQQDDDGSSSTVTNKRNMVDRVSILGMQHDNGLADVLVTTFDDDTGHVWATPTPNDTTTLSKRHDGAGFKINYRTISYANNVLGSPTFDSLYRDAALGIGNNWAARADNDKIDELVGTTGLVDPKLLTFGFRIIPELQGFGENYESVDICDTLVPTHDEL